MEVKETVTNVVSSLLLVSSLFITSGLVDIWLDRNMRSSSQVRNPGEITNLFFGIV